jgi:hypothetical protein
MPTFSPNEAHADKMLPLLSRLNLKHHHYGETPAVECYHLPAWENRATTNSDAQYRPVETCGNRVVAASSEIKSLASRPKPLLQWDYGICVFITQTMRMITTDI